MIYGYHIFMFGDFTYSSCRVERKYENSICPISCNTYMCYKFRGRAWDFLEIIFVVLEVTVPHMNYKTFIFQQPTLFFFSLREVYLELSIKSLLEIFTEISFFSVSAYPKIANVKLIVKFRPIDGYLCKCRVIFFYLGGGHSYQKRFVTRNMAKRSAKTNAFQFYIQ